MSRDMSRIETVKNSYRKVSRDQGCGSGSWKQLNFWGSTLKKEAESELKLGSMTLQEEPEAKNIILLQMRTSKLLNCKPRRRLSTVVLLRFISNCYINV